MLLLHKILIQKERTDFTIRSSAKKGLQTTAVALEVKVNISHQIHYMSTLAVALAYYALILSSVKLWNVDNIVEKHTKKEILTVYGYVFELP